MGAAKRAGTYEQRVAAAQARNTQIEKVIDSGNNHEMKEMRKRYGTRRLVSALIASQVLRKI